MQYEFSHGKHHAESEVNNSSSSGGGGGGGSSVLGASINFINSIVGAGIIGW